MWYIEPSNTTALSLTMSGVPLPGITEPDHRVVRVIDPLGLGHRQSRAEHTIITANNVIRVALMTPPLELKVEKSKVESCRPPTRCGSGRDDRACQVRHCADNWRWPDDVDGAAQCAYLATSGSAKGELARRSRQDVSFSTRRCSRRASREGARHADSPRRARSLVDLGDSGCQAPPRNAPCSLAHCGRIVVGSLVTLSSTDP